MPSRPQQTVMAEATKVTARLSVTWPVPGPQLSVRKTLSAYFVILRDGPLEKLWEEAGGGGGGSGRSTEKLFAQGKIKWKKIMHVN